MQKEICINKIIEKYADMVYRIALTRCGTVENAEDVFQDVFMKYSEKSQNLKILSMKKHGLLELQLI